MQSNMTELLACPDCRGELEALGPEIPSTGVFACQSCKTLFPITEGIPILLPKAARCFELEQPLLRAWLDSLQGQLPPREFVDNTWAILEKARDRKSWEWEDEEFWSQEYEKESTEPKEKNWNDRFWQREFVLKPLIKRSSLRGSTILDVGCGQGQNFRQLLQPHCDEDTLYIGADVSLAGLKLNRERNPHRRSLYVLCSADRLPFRTGSIDLLCYFGILHHTERKEASMSEDSRLLRPGGHMVVHEALDRPHLTPAFMKRHLLESAHEERIPREAFMRQVNGLSEMRVICSRQMHTILLGGMMKLLRWPMLRSKALFSTITTLDVFCRRTLGNLVPFFRPGEVLLLMQKSPQSH